MITTKRVLTLILIALIAFFALKSMDTPKSEPVTPVKVTPVRSTPKPTPTPGPTPTPKTVVKPQPVVKTKKTFNYKYNSPTSVSAPTYKPTTRKYNYTAPDYSNIAPPPTSKPAPTFKPVKLTNPGVRPSMGTPRPKPRDCYNAGGGSAVICL